MLDGGKTRTENYFNDFKYKFKSEPFDTSVEYDMKVARVDDNRSTHHPCQGVFEFINSASPGTCGSGFLEETGIIIANKELKGLNAFSCIVDVEAKLKSANQKYQEPAVNEYEGTEYISIDAGASHNLYFLSFERSHDAEGLFRKGLSDKVIVYPAMTHNFVTSG